MASSRWATAGSTQLPSDFQPGEHDVICPTPGFARSTDRHLSNTNFQKIIEDNLELYMQTSNKNKGAIVLSIVDIVRGSSPNGGFIDFCRKNKCYVEVGDSRARAKVRRVMREAIAACKARSIDGSRAPLTTRKKEVIETFALQTIPQEIKEGGDGRPAPTGSETGDSPTDNGEGTSCDGDSLSSLASLDKELAEFCDESSLSSIDFTEMPTIQAGEHDVICFSSRADYHHIGNITFQKLIHKEVGRYVQAKESFEKRRIIDSVLDMIRSSSGGFVGFCKQNSCYVKVTDTQARQKIGFAFRNATSRGGRRLPDKRRGHFSSEVAVRRKVPKSPQKQHRVEPFFHDDKLPDISSPGMDSIDSCDDDSFLFSTASIGMEESVVVEGVNTL